jgi:hypothetical protein
MTLFRSAEFEKLAQSLVAIRMLAQGFEILCSEIRRVIAEQEKARSEILCHPADLIG